MFGVRSMNWFLFFIWINKCYILVWCQNSNSTKTDLNVPFLHETHIYMFSLNKFEYLLVAGIYEFPEKCYFLSSKMCRRYQTCFFFSLRIYAMFNLSTLNRKFAAWILVLVLIYLMWSHFWSKRISDICRRRNKDKVFGKIGMLCCDLKYVTGCVDDMAEVNKKNK